jgi:hypothetical protein
VLATSDLGSGSVCPHGEEALCYNFTRVLNILGFEGFVAYMAAKALAARLYALAAALNRIQLVLGAFRTHIVSRLAISRFGPVPVG